MFKYSTSEIDNVAQPLFRLPFRCLYDLLRKKTTPVRAISDVAIRRYIKFLFCKGTIYELGGPNEHYKNFSPADQNYQITDLNPASPMPMDMTCMPFADNSIDAFFSAFALEHVREYNKAIAEIKRTLKPGGRVLLAVPFLYYYHAAPDDYVRFTSSYLNELFSDMKILANVPVGTRGLCIANFLDEHPFTPVNSPKFLYILYKIFSLLLVIRYIIFPKQAPGFASAHIILAEKCD